MHARLPALTAPLLALLSAAVALQPSYAAKTFYLSSSGDDGAAGTSPATAWKSLRRAGSVRLAVGDALLLKRGEQWIVESGDALVLRNASGLVSSYGKATESQPLIQVSSRGSWAACVRLYDATQLTVTGLRLAGCGAGVLVTQSVPVTRDIAIVNNVFADIRGPMQTFLPAGSSRPAPWVQDWGVAVALATLNTSFDPKNLKKTVNLTVANNAAVRIDQFYANSQPGPGWNDGPLGDGSFAAWGSRHPQRGIGGSAGRRQLQAGARRMNLQVEGCALRGNTVQGCGYNCVEMGGITHMTLSDSVFLRDTPPDMFVYGTTDIILGGVDGTSKIVDNDFNRRGEYEGGPDGCAIDFETSANGVRVEGNTIYKSWGAGIMVFGHATTSHNLSISNNSFIEAGCIQTRGDRAAIAFTCPNHQKASGFLNHNLFQTCSGKGVVDEAFHEGYPGCTSDWTKVGNLIDSKDPSAQMVQEPRINVPPTLANSAVLPVTAQSITPNVTFRYTLDGSRPTEQSPEMPSSGVPLPWPGPVLAINFRGFKEGMRPSVTNGVVLELSYMWPDPGKPPPPPAHAACPGLPGVMCSACPPATMPLKCAAGQKVDFVSLAGDDGSCDCDSYCASDWNGGSLGRLRPHWIGATSAFPPGVASTCCVCVQATHWCEKQKPEGLPCSLSCNTTGKPLAKDYCVPQ